MNEITVQCAALSGSTLYATIDQRGQRWNGTAFEPVLGAHWATYAVDLTESPETGFFLGSIPGGINTPGRLDVSIFRQAGTGPLPLSDNEAAFTTLYWDGSAETGSDVRTDPTATSQGPVVSATWSTITLSTAARPAANVTGTGFVLITGGTGKGQKAHILNYTPGTGVATIEGTWTTIPDATSYALVYSETEWRKTLSPTGLDSVLDTDTPGPPTTFRARLNWMYRRQASATINATQLITRDSSGNPLTTQAVSDDGTTATLGEPC